MHRVLLAVDRFNALIGRTAAWAILALTLVISYEVFARYLFRNPTSWAFDASYMLYGALFMLGGAYTLSRNGHVRGDFLYRSWSPRRQAWMDLVLYFLFFFPGIAALVWAGYLEASRSWAIGERSNSPGAPILYPFKTLIPIVGCLMLLQGAVEVIRCLDCIRTGRWPQRLKDVEELEKLILEEAAAKRRAAGEGGR